MSKYVECKLNLMKDEFSKAATKLGYKIGNKVNMYYHIYDVDISADDKVGISGGKLIFDSMNRHHANRIIEEVYVNRLQSRFGNIDIQRSETQNSIILKIRR